MIDNVKFLIIEIFTIFDSVLIPADGNILKSRTNEEIEIFNKMSCLCDVNRLLILISISKVLDMFRVYYAYSHVCLLVINSNQVFTMQPTNAEQQFNTRATHQNRFHFFSSSYQRLET